MKKTFGIWKCAECNKEAPATVHQLRKTYCSNACMSAGYKKLMSGSNNPNYKRAGHQKCQHCAKDFHSYSRRKFCSNTCYVESKLAVSTRKANCAWCDKTFLKPVKTSTYCCRDCMFRHRASLSKPKQANPKRTRLVKKCMFCATEFASSPSMKRKYCSLSCFYASGGAKRAGDAAVMATRKYGAKKDANHKEIFDAIKAFTAVHDLSAAGFGVPDGLAWINDGWQLFDVKNPNTGYGKRGLNKRQKEWASDWRGGPVYLIYTVEEAQAFAQGKLDDIKKFPDDK
jgi:hypothetical protein